VAGHVFGGTSGGAGLCARISASKKDKRKGTSDGQSLSLLPTSLPSPTLPYHQCLSSITTSALSPVRPKGNAVDLSTTSTPEDGLFKGTTVGGVVVFFGQQLIPSLGNWPYPEAEDIWARSTTIEEGERFEELLLSDFIEVGRRVGRRTLRRLSGAPFEEALLERGLRGLHSVEEADLTNDQVTLGAKGGVPGRYTASTSQGNGQSTHQKPNRYIANTFRIF